ncbi:MAG: tryptophan synthase subunit alpha [Gemmataceae bacterium]
MNRIDLLFAEWRRQGQRALIPFLTAGDPSLEATASFLVALREAGTSLIEIGFPYSDPIADGPVIQSSYTRALSRRVRIEDVLRQAPSWLRTPSSDRQVDAPDAALVAMVSYSIIYRRGPERFLNQLLQAGFAGLIVPDLPYEESGPLVQLARSLDLALIQLITPQTPDDRALRIAERSSGFIYYVSVTGITGARQYIPDGLVERVGWLRERVSLPVCVGFGISHVDQVCALRQVVDGIIVGSAIVSRIEQVERLPQRQVLEDIRDFVTRLRQALNA